MPACAVFDAAGQSGEQMHDFTLRQVEVIRAVLLHGTINGAAEHLGVPASGVSRLVKHTEESLGSRLFERRGGLFVPSIEAGAVFDQIREVYKGVENLQNALRSLQKRQDVRLSFASAPSVAQFIAARAIRNVRRSYPDLFIDVNILKIEETLDYLLLERGEFVIMSSSIDNPGVDSTPIAGGRLVAILPEAHPLAQKAELSIEGPLREPLIGIDPADPYGAIMAKPFRDAGIEPQYCMRGRFDQTVVSLARHGLGVALIDEFSPETAKNAAVGGAFIPMMTLGIPGDAVTAIMIGALFIYGLNPGPMLMIDQPHMFWFIVGTLCVANCFMLLFGLTGIKLFTKIVKMPRAVLIPLIMLLSIVGAYAVNNAITDVYWVLGFGVFGYFMRHYGYPLGPVILGVILSRLLDDNWHRAIISDLEDLGRFFVGIVSSPLSLVLFIAVILIFVSQMSLWAQGKALFKREKA
jgi:DNA-binding transcriptional LysR family regulator